MRVEQSAPGAAAAAGFRCSGLQILFHEAEPIVRLVPGKRRLADGLTASVLQGLSSARDLVEEILHLDPAGRPYDKVEVALGPGALTQGEATSVAAGCIRVFAGEEAPAEEAGHVARHEALHLLLASTLAAGELWNDPELAFADWIVRGIECGLDAGVPRFHGRAPQILDRLPASRLEVQRRIAEVAAAPEASRRYFGEALCAELLRLRDGDPAAAAQRQLWLVEAALGTHYLEAAGRVLAEDGEALRAVVLDDWLCEYDQYARSVGNAPSAAGNLWRISEAGYSRDPIVRLSVAAQALQRDDQCVFAAERFGGADEPVVWKSRGRVRLPLVRARPRPRPPPVHGLRAVLRGVDTQGAAEAVAIVEEAARSGADRFEARALWPRIVARLFGAGLPPPDVEPETAALPAVQVVESDGGTARQAFEEWSLAAAALRSVAGDLARWVPLILPPAHVEALHEAPRRRAALQLVYAAPLAPASLVGARTLAARRPVRGALFTDLRGGSAYERVPDIDEPVDPRYREQVWTSGPVPHDAADLVRLADEGTCDGTVTTPVCHLLSLLAIGLEECEYHLARGPRAARG